MGTLLWDMSLWTCLIPQKMIHHLLIHSWCQHKYSYANTSYSYICNYFFEYTEREPVYIHIITPLPLKLKAKTKNPKGFHVTWGTYIRFYIAYIATIPLSFFFVNMTLIYRNLLGRFIVGTQIQRIPTIYPKSLNNATLPATKKSNVSSGLASQKHLLFLLKFGNFGGQWIYIYICFDEQVDKEFFGGKQLGLMWSLLAI